MEFNKKLNILVTGCGGDIGQSIGKILLNSNFTKNLYGIDISDRNAAPFIYPNFYLGLRCSEPDYINNLEIFVEKHEIDVLIPIAEPELRFLSQQKIFYNIGKAKIVMASPLALEVGFDKYLTAKFLEDEKLPFPFTTLFENSNVNFKFPIILKSRTGSGSKDFHIIKSKDELLFYAKDNENYVIQEFLSGDDGEFTCGVFRSRNGEVRTQIFKRELTGGYSGYGEVIRNESITLLLEKLAVSLDLVGSINVQLRISNNLPKIFEINPRFSSTVLFRDLFGFKDLIWSIEDLLGHRLSEYVEVTEYTKFYKGFNEYIK